MKLLKRETACQYDAEQDSFSNLSKAALAWVYMVKAILLAASLTCCYWACCGLAEAASAEFDFAKRLQQSGKPAEAHDAFQAIVKRAAAGSEEQALAYMELCRIDLDAGRYASAIANGGLAHEIFRKQRDPTNDGKALTLSAMARLYSGAYQDALREMETALDIARKTKDKAAEITRLNNVGTVYYFEARYADALQQYQAAMSLVEAAHGEDWVASRRQLSAANIATVYQKMGQYQRALDTYSNLLKSSSALATAEQAQLLANMGTLYRRLGDPFKALDTYHAAQVLYRQHGMRNGEISVLNNIGIAQGLDLGRLNDALQTFERALTMAETSQDRPVALHSLLYRAETEYRLNQFSKAYNDFVKANTLSLDLHASDEEWKALYGLARIAEHNGQTGLVGELLKQSVAVIESLRNAGPGSLRMGFLADKRQVYDALLKHLGQQHVASVNEILRLMELSRARDVQDKTTPEKHVTVEQIQQTIGADATVLEYTVGQDFILALWIGRSGSGYGISLRDPGLRRSLTALNASLSRTSDENWQNSAGALSDLLLKPVTKVLGTTDLREIIIVPDREVTGVPFDALPDPTHTPQLMVSRFSITYLPSVALLPEKHQRRKLLLFSQRTMLAVADPAPGTGTDSPFVSRLSTIGRLPAAAREIEQISAMVGGRAARFVGRDAQKTALRVALSGGFPLVHLATHAYSDPDDPARSYLLFAPTRLSQGYDPMFLKEVEGLNLKSADLVTVSACETDAGKLVEGEGIESFSRAFLKAGARATVTTLWQVGDQAASEMMRLFYLKLSEGVTAGRALQRAKLEYLARHSGGRLHPFYWAGFLLNGDPQVQAPGVISGFTVAAFCLAVAGLVLGLYSRLHTGSKHR